MTRLASLLAGITAVLAVVAAPAQAQIRTVASFDPSRGEFPENVTIDGRTGNIYVSFLLIGQILKIAPDGTQSRIFMPAGTFLTAGMVMNDKSGSLYVALTSADPANTGIWELRPDGSLRLYAHVAGGMLNGLTANKAGELYIADSFLGVVWKVAAGGGEGALWLDLLAPGNVQAPGPNGIKFAPSGDLYVSISNQARIVRIPLLPGGLAGTPSTYVQGPDILPDDFAFDRTGNLYVANEPTTNVMRIHPDGSREILASVGDGLSNTSAVIFGRPQGHDDVNLYITNPGFMPGVGNGPSLMELPIGMRGYQVATWGPYDYPYEYDLY